MKICTNMVLEAKQQLEKLLGESIARAVEKGALPKGEVPAIQVEIPSDTTHGDFASNLAMVGARAFRMAPPKIAQAILDNLELKDSYFVRAEMAGPGFLNFFLDRDWFSQALLSIAELGDDYGRTNYGGGEKVMVEFVSANPTGPMHMGNARGGAIGDCLAAALDAAGYDVSREFYVNDAGNQIEKFALSLEARYLQIYKGEEAVPFPEDGYHGEDIKDRAKEFAATHGDKYMEADAAQRREALVGYALPHNIEKLKEDLATYRITFDTWFRESSLYADGTVERTVKVLEEKGLTYEKDGAVWYKATKFGGEKDEVLIRQNGNATYFAADIAYHYNKFVVRGFRKVINIWGADHHGHVARLKGAMDALGLHGDDLEIVLMQLVRLMKDGEPYRMSKRTGRSITLRDLLEEVPIDAARFLFNMRDPGSSMDFDLDLAVEQSTQNPVHYVRYAHARICSIVKGLDEDGVAIRPCSAAELAQLETPEEIELIRSLAQYPEIIIGAATRYDPASFTHYATHVANLFHKFYEKCNIRKLEDGGLKQGRIQLCLAARTVFANVLRLMKITAPESI